MRVLVLVCVLMLVGCASEDYSKYIASQESMQLARSNAEIAKYKAMADIGSRGDTTVQVAAMMAMLGLQGSSMPVVNITPPKSGWDTAREWLGIILPVAVQGYAISANARVAINAANNSKDVAVSTNNAFVGMAGKIQAPAANVSTITKTTDSHAVDSHAVDTHEVTTNTNKTTTDTTTTSTATDSYNTATATDSYNPNNSNQGNPVNNTNNSNQGNPTDNSNQNNPITNPQVSATP